MGAGAFVLFAVYALASLTPEAFATLQRFGARLPWRRPETTGHAGGGCT